MRARLFQRGLDVHFVSRQYARPTARNTRLSWEKVSATRRKGSTRMRSSGKHQWVYICGTFVFSCRWRGQRSQYKTKLEQTMRLSARDWPVLYGTLRYGTVPRRYVVRQLLFVKQARVNGTLHALNFDLNTEKVENNRGWGHWGEGRWEGGGGSWGCNARWIT